MNEEIDDEIVRSSILQRMQEKYRAKRLLQKNDDAPADIHIHIYEDDFSSELGLGFKRIGTMLQDFRKREYKGKIGEIFVDQLRSDIDVFLRGKMEPEDIIRKGKSYYDVTLTNFLPHEELGGTKLEIYQDNNWWTITAPGMRPAKICKNETSDGKHIMEGVLLIILKDPIGKARGRGEVKEAAEKIYGEIVDDRQLSNAADGLNKKFKEKKLPLKVVADEAADTLCLVFSPKDSKIR